MWSSLRDSRSRQPFELQKGEGLVKYHDWFWSEILRRSRASCYVVFSVHCGGKLTPRFSSALKRSPQLGQQHLTKNQGKSKSPASGLCTAFLCRRRFCGRMDDFRRAAASGRGEQGVCAPGSAGGSTRRHFTRVSCHLTRLRRCCGLHLKSWCCRWDKMHGGGG